MYTRHALVHALVYALVYGGAAQGIGQGCFKGPQDRKPSTVKSDIVPFVWLILELAVGTGVVGGMRDTFDSSDPDAYDQGMVAATLGQCTKPHEWHHGSPFSLFQNGAKSLDLRCVLHPRIDRRWVGWCWVQ